MRSMFALLLAGGLMTAIAAPASAQIPFSVTSDAPGLFGIDDANLTMFSLTLPGEIGDLVSLQLDINGLSHTNPDDLDIYLIKPTVAAVTVLQDQGDGVAIVDQNFTFADSAVDPAPVDSELFPGTYQPSGLSQSGQGFDNTFLGNGGAGLWTLVVIDDSAGDTGTFDSWTLSGTYVPEPMTMSLLALGALATLRRKRR